MSQLSFAQVTAPDLICATTQGNGEVLLTWENNHGCGPNFLGTHIYSSESPSGPFVEIAVEPLVATTQYTDVSASSNNNTLYYYITSECNAGTSVSSDTLDQLDPIPPVIINLTVIADQVQINWLPGASPETESYQVYRYVNGNPIAIGSPTTNTVYTDVDATPTDFQERYVVRTIDACGNGGPLSEISHASVFLVAKDDSCNGKIKLEWSTYDGWDQIEEIEVITEPEGVIATLSGGESYYDYEIQVGDEDRKFKIRVYETVGGIYSESNEIDIAITNKLPDYLYVKNATVLDNNQVYIEWLVDENGIFDDFQLNRGRVDSDLDEIFSYEMGELLAEMNFTDTKVKASRYSFQYELLASEKCGQTLSSGLVKTISLGVKDNFDLSNQLTWTPFEIPHGTVSAYEIYRKEGATFNLLNTVNGSTFTYRDEVAAFFPEDDQYCYKVVAFFKLELPDGQIFDLTSDSNRACMDQLSRMYIPNAFTPNGVNNEFKPVFVFPNEDDYTMLIMNRWGELIFESNEPSKGWDGKVRSEIAPQGVYPYVIRMTSRNGSLLERKGTVLLLR